MVGASGFEPPTSASRTRRANQAALRPDANNYKSSMADIASEDTKEIGEEYVNT